MFAKLCAVRANRGNRNKKGFTLAELLIVVAIIGVLIAIAIPVFSSSLDKAQKAVYTANCRSALSEATYEYMLGNRATLNGKEYTYDEDKGTKYTCTITGNTLTVTCSADSSITFSKDVSAAPAV